MKTPNENPHGGAAASGSSAEFTPTQPAFPGAPFSVSAVFSPQRENPVIWPEFAKLPRPHERCSITGASRSWLLDHDSEGKYLVRIRQRGKLRGAVFIIVPKLLAYLRSATVASDEGRDE